MEVDPEDISTLAQLAGALDQLRLNRSLSLQGLADNAAKLPRRNGRQPTMPRSTASHLLNARSVPEAETVVTFLAACGIRDEQTQRPWLQALDRIANQHQRRPPGAVRVRDARPRLLGVHAAIQIDQTAAHDRSGPGHEDELPPYVPRDFDADLRTKLIVAGQRGGFVLLVGESSVGKTRALFEAVRAVLPDWWLLHPGTTTGLREFPVQSASRTVLWLDELQDYLDHPEGVPTGHVRGLVEAGAVLVATCWPDEYSKRAALPGHSRPDPYVNDRRLLGLADVVNVSEVFSTDERRRAEELAITDRRIRAALDTPDAGFTQVMAGGLELIRHWGQAPAYADAVITAALDARRVGAHAPLTREYFNDAAPGYLKDWQIATAPADWLDHALDYATRLLRGAIAILAPVHAGMGRIAGYRVADYLHQHALRVRRTEHLPDLAWQALIRHHHPDDTHRLADNAERRGREDEALILTQELAASGHRYADYHLVPLLGKRGQLDELLALTTSDHEYIASDAARQLAELWLERGQVDDAIQMLRSRADGGDTSAARELAELWLERGQVDDAIRMLYLCADGGNQFAASELAKLLIEHGRVEEARARADGGDRYAAIELERMFVEQGRVEDAIQVLRAHAERGSSRAANHLSRLLEEQGQIEDAIQVLVPVIPLTGFGGNDTRRSVDRWTRLLIEHKQMDTLRAHADSGNAHAALSLAYLLAQEGQVEELRARADNGDGYAICWLATLMIEQGHVEDGIRMLRARADSGDTEAADWLARKLADQGNMEELRARADSGDANAAERLARMLADQGNVDELRARAGRGDARAAEQLAHTLVDLGNVEELCTRLDDGDPFAASWASGLAVPLIGQGKFEDAIETLRLLADRGDYNAPARLIELLTEHKRVEELEQEVAAGTEGAVSALSRLRSQPSDAP